MGNDQHTYSVSRAEKNEANSLHIVAFSPVILVDARFIRVSRFGNKRARSLVARNGPWGYMWGGGRWLTEILIEGWFKFAGRPASRQDQTGEVRFMHGTSQGLREQDLDFTSM